MSRSNNLEEEKPKWESKFDSYLKKVESPSLNDKEDALFHLTHILYDRDYKNINSENKILKHDQKLLDVLDCINNQGSDREHCLLYFAKYLLLEDDSKSTLRSWLAEAEDKELFSQETLAIVFLQTELYDQTDWNKAKDEIEVCFDHSNNLVRASAGEALASLYTEGAKNLPPIGNTMELIKSKDIERPGIAGPFIGALLCNDFDNYQTDLTEWLLEIIEKRKTPEPLIDGYNGIDFHQHEYFSKNSVAVKRLIDLGEDELAGFAATEENSAVQGMKPLLEKLAYSDDAFTARTCSWQLAYVYRTLHPEGAIRGYVKKFELNYFEVFLVYTIENNQRELYAATVYPPGQTTNPDNAEDFLSLIKQMCDLNENESSIALSIDSKYARFTDDNELSFDLPNNIVSLYGNYSNKEWQRAWIKWPLIPEN